MAHEPLSALDDADLERDLADNRAALASVLGREPRAFCYPFGGRGTWNARVVTALRRLGFQCACTTVWGLNDRTTDPFELRRLDGSAMRTFAAFLMRVQWARLKWRLRAHA
jgi:peptidoglycan/xylan/chitin deacetylase (PgdA/CDA1 family)